MSVHWGGPGAGHVSRWSVATTGVPVLSLDFLTSNTLDPRVTFTRSTTATFVGSNGLIQTAAINAPRFDYNPATLVANGLLIEEQRVNLLLNSDILGTNLSTQSVTVTAQSYTISFYGTGTITLSGAAIQIVTGTGAYPSRRTLTFTPTAGVLICTVTGTVQFAQLEAGAFATSFIPTVASTVTRAADITSMTGTNFSSWYNQSEGTIVAQFVATTTGVTSTGGSAFPFVYEIDSAAASNSSNQLILSSGYGPGWNASTTILGVTQASLQGSMSLGNASVRKIAYAYRTNDFAASANGGAVVTDTSGTLPSPDRIGIGCQNSSGSNTFTGYMRTLTFYPSRLTDAQLQALTA